MRKHLITAASVIALAAAGVWLYRYFSPFHYCLRHYEAEAISNGQNRETAQTYARNLCVSKNPLRN